MAQYPSQGGYPQPPPQQYQQYQQYPQQPQMNPQVVNQGPIVGGQKDWKYGLLDCFGDCGLCIKTSCCSCITYGETKAKLINDPGSCYCNSFFYYCAGTVGLNWLLGALTRTEVRTKHNIPGSQCGDICTHCWCCCCALIQEHREVHDA